MTQTTAGKITLTYDFTCRACNKESSRYLSGVEVNGKHGKRFDVASINLEPLSGDLMCQDCIVSGKANAYAQTVKENVA